MRRVPKNILRLPLEKRAEMAFREAVDEVIDEHARLGLPIYIGRDGRVVELSPDEVRDLSRIDSGQVGEASVRLRVKLHFRKLTAEATCKSHPILFPSSL